MTVVQSNVELLPKRKPKGRGRSNPSTAKKIRITVDTNAPATPDSLRRWIKVQVPYENLAGKDEALDKKATAYVLDIVKLFQQSNIERYRIWAVIQRMMDTMQGGAGEGETAEMYKARERMIPKIQEAVLGYQKWFRVHGRTKSDIRQTDLIAAFLSYQLDEDNHHGRVQPGIRAMLDYGFCVTKTWWDTRIERRMRRKSVKRMHNGKEKVTTIIDEHEEVVFNGPRGRLIDPYDFIIEDGSSTYTDVQSVKYIGDIGRQSYSELKQGEVSHGYKNIDQLREQSPINRWDYNRWYKEDRRRDDNSTNQERKIDGLPMDFDVCEIWGRFDLHGTGLDLPCVITVANWQTIIRIQENPFDDKHVPYAVARANHEPFNFFGVAPFDNCIRPAMHMNEHRSLGLRAHKIALAPIIIGSENNDITESLLEIEPGTYIGLEDPASLKELKMTSTMGDVAAVDGIHRMDIEEISGSTRALSGTGQSETATEDTNKLRESSRRLRSYIHAYAEMKNQELRQFHSMNTQFVTTAMKFRVLGKPAAGLEAYEEIDPEVIQTKIDFTFTALASLHSGELRASQIIQALNLSAPISAKYPGQIDELGIIKQFYFDVLGGSMDVDDIVKIPTPPHMLASQEQENVMLVQSQVVDIDTQDDHEDHLRIMDETVMPLLETLPGFAQGKILEHYAKHQRAAEQQKRVEQQKQQGPATDFAAPANELDPNRGTTGNQQMPGDVPGLIQGPGSGGSGLPGQRAGETPGPAGGMHSQAAPDRQMSLFQNQQSTG